MTMREYEIALNTLEVAFSILFEEEVQEVESACTPHLVDTTTCLLDARSHLLKHLEQCGYQTSWSTEYRVWEVSKKNEKETQS